MSTILGLVLISSTVFAGECTKIAFRFNNEQIPTCIEQFIWAQSQADVDRFAKNSSEGSIQYSPSYTGSFVGFVLQNLDSSARADFLRLYSEEANKVVSGNQGNSGGLVINPFSAIKGDSKLESKLENLLNIYVYLRFEEINKNLTLNEYKKANRRRTDLIEQQFVVSNSGLRLMK